LQNRSTVTPYKTDAEKKEQVAEMFDNIAGSYDFLNHFLSLGIDKMWRTKAINSLREVSPKKMLDVATGTADLAVASMKLKPESITGIDISNKMLEVGRTKVAKKGLTDVINLEWGDSENLPFDDNSFDAITVAFGVRNFENLDAGLSEMYRVLKPGGKMAVLEFSNPNRFPIKQLFGFYFKNVLPTLGKMVSKDNRAYTYLPESVKVFPERKEFTNILEKLSFKDTTCEPLTFGIACLYTAKKK